jgi:DNA-binding NtrC family response regulator
MREEKRDVLILDEETDSLMNLFDWVYGKGYETIGVSTEREALSLVARRKPEVLIDHRHHPSAEEPRFLERTKALSPRTRIIRLAASEDRCGMSGRSIQREEVDWIGEPYEESELLGALSRAAEGGISQESGKRQGVPQGEPRSLRLAGARAMSS